MHFSPSLIIVASLLTYMPLTLGAPVLDSNIVAGLVTREPEPAPEPGVIGKPCPGGSALGCTVKVGH